MTNRRGLTGSGRRSVSLGPNDPRARRNGDAFLGGARNVKAPLSYRDGKIVLDAGSEFEVDAQGKLRLRLAAPLLLLGTRLGVDLSSFLAGEGADEPNIQIYDVDDADLVADTVTKAFRATDDIVIGITSNLDDLVITMPEITSQLSRRIRRVKSSASSGSKPVTVTPAGSQTVDGSTSLALAAGEVVTLTHDGSSDWVIL